MQSSICQTFERKWLSAKGIIVCLIIFCKPFKVSEVIILVFLTQTVAVTLPLIDKKCKEPRCYATDTLNANPLGDPKSERYLQSCNVAYQVEIILYLQYIYL